MTELAFPAKHLQRVAGLTTGPTPFFTASAERLHHRLGDTKRRFATILNLSDDGGTSQALLPMADTTPQTDTEYDLIVANLTLTTLNDPVATLHTHLQQLSPDGLFLGTTLGAESFREFRVAFHQAGLPTSGRTTPLPDVQECGTLLTRLKLAMPVVDRDLITLTFADFPSLYRNLRAHGSHNWHPARAPYLTTPRQFAAMEQAYRAAFPRDDGRLPLTLELIHLHAWQPHTSQPKALKPGTGKISLVRILPAP